MLFGRSAPSGGGGNPSPSEQLHQILIDGLTVADYQAGIGLTGTTNASAWANQLGSAGPLVQASGPNQPSIESDGSLLFDGAAQFIKTAAFTLAQPATFYLVLKQVAWADNTYIFDGNTSASMALTPRTTTPQVQLYAGALSNTNSDLTVGAYAVVTALFNGASSILNVNSGTDATGNPGAQAADGFTLGAIGGSAANFANIQVKRIIIRSSADSAALQLQIQALLGNIYGIAL